MAAFGPFEPCPVIAVAVSGGADSLALALLLNDWAATRRGSVRAMVVDHRLRPDSTVEARRVCRQLRSLGLQTDLLTWRGERPRVNIQAAARAARYELLSAACAGKGILHLALGHHLEDQAETLLLRLGRGSGLDGLSAMAAQSERRDLRLIRPLLGISKRRLLASLQARKVTWIEDPSNHDRTHARVRLRQELAGPLAGDLPAPRLAQAAGALGTARAYLEVQLERLLLASVSLHPGGFARLNLAAWRSAPDPLRLLALSRVLTVIGGADYGPRFERLSGLAARLMESGFRAATLAGCRLTLRSGVLLITRETRAVATIPLAAGEKAVWDQRFAVAVRSQAGRSAFHMAPLGPQKAADLRNKLKQTNTLTGIPAIALSTFPALFDRHGVLEVPHIGYSRRGKGVSWLAKCLFSPKNSLTKAGFTVA